MIRTLIIQQSKKMFHTTLKRNELIETPELAQIIKKGNIKDIRILDCSFYVPTEGLVATDLYKKERIPYSQFFDIDEVADKSTDLPHMIADEATFISLMKKMDIRKKDHIICYDRKGMFSAPRVWFNLKIFGHNNISVLNGGYPKWIKEGLPVEKGDDYMVKSVKRDPAEEGDFNYKLDKSKLVNLEQVLKLSKRVRSSKTNEQIIDCRAAPRFKGEAEEPRPTKRKGHVAGASNVPFKDLLTDDNCFKSPEEIEKEFKNKKIDLERPITLYCGSGTTACVDIFALHMLGLFDKCRLYDGSWAELGNITEEEIKQKMNNIKI